MILDGKMRALKELAECIWSPFTEDVSEELAWMLMVCFEEYVDHDEMSEFTDEDALELYSAFLTRDYSCLSNHAVKEGMLNALAFSDERLNGGSQGWSKAG